MNGGKESVLSGSLSILGYANAQPAADHPLHGEAIRHCHAGKARGNFVAS